MGKYLDSTGLANLIGKIKTALGLKQDTLVSGTNIKTVNNQSLLGSGNIAISGGSSLPSGGAANDVLAKNSSTEGDLKWLTLGEVAMLDSGDFGALAWEDSLTYSDVGAAASSHTHSYLPLSGGMLTGNLGVKSTVTLGTNTTAEENGIRLKGGGTRNAWVLRTISAANGDGDAVLLGDGGLTIIGAGEAAPNLWDALGVSAGSETLHLASDTSILFHTNCQTIADRQTAYITSNGSIVGPNNHVVKLAGVDSSASDNGVSGSIYRYHSFLDESDRHIGWLGTAVHKDGGQIWTTMAARRRQGSANLDNTLGLGVNADGDYLVTITSGAKAPWRSALGLGTAATHADTDYADATHSHSEYFSDQVNRTANTVLAAPNGSAGHAGFRKLVVADLPETMHYYAASSATNVTVANTSLYRFLVILFRTNSATYTGGGTSAATSPLNSTVVHINKKSSGSVYVSLMGAHAMSGSSVQIRTGLATVTCSTTAGKVTLSNQRYINLGNGSSGTQEVGTQTDMALVGVIGIY